MKNVLSYYYNLNPTDIHQINKMYKFKENNNFYALIEITDSINSINDIYNVSIELNNRGIYTHQIILNIQGSIVTQINNNNYVLLKIYNDLDKTIELDDIIKFSNITSNIVTNKNLRRDNWYELWTNKIDYFEYQISQIGKRFPLIRESFSYFVGIVETGISLLANNNIKDISLCICLDRIKKNNNLFDLYNPFNFIIDMKVRNTSEYFKEMFIYEDPYFKIIDYINYGNLSDDELKLFYIRMFYPSFYFDTYEKIINGDIEEIEINKIVDKAYDYQLLLKKLYIYINNITSLPEIEWIKKM